MLDTYSTAPKLSELNRHRAFSDHTSDSRDTSSHLVIGQCGFLLAAAQRYRVQQESQMVSKLTPIYNIRFPCQTPHKIMHSKIMHSKIMGGGGGSARGSVLFTFFYVKHSASRST
jgi:hypothetical protein